MIIVIMTDCQKSLTLIELAAWDKNTLITNTDMRKARETRNNSHCRRDADATKLWRVDDSTSVVWTGHQGHCITHWLTPSWIPMINLHVNMSIPTCSSFGFNDTVETSNLSGKAQLWQRERATLKASWNLVKCCTINFEWAWRSFACCRTYQMQFDEHLCDICMVSTDKARRAVLRR